MKYFYIPSFIYVFLCGEIAYASLNIIDLPDEPEVFCNLTLSPTLKPEPIEDVLEADEATKIQHCKSARCIPMQLISAICTGRIYIRDTTEPILHLISGETVKKSVFSSRFFTKDYCDKAFSSSLLGKGNNFEDHLKEIFGPENFGLPPIDPDQRKDWFLNNEIGFLNKGMISGIFSAAQKIIKLTAPGDNIVIFGNTPYYVGRALKVMKELDPSIDRNIIEFAFSGSPNARREGCFQDPTADIVTPERLAHLQTRLHKHGLMADNPEMLKRKTHFVDVIGSGRGIATTMETILCNFKKNKPGSYPHLDVIALNEIGSGRNALITSEQGKDGKQVTLTFPALDKQHFTVPCHIAYLYNHGVLDNVPDAQPALRVVPKYNMCYQVPEFDYLLTQEKTTVVKIMFEHFDTNIKHLLTSKT